MRTPLPRRVGPIEIILGSLLSLVLGILLAALYLVLKPVEIVTEMPKEPKAKALYYLEGRKDWTGGRRWMFKREAFIQGRSVRVTEDELNAWIESIYPPPPPAPADKAAAEKEIAELPFLQARTPTVRILGDELEIGFICQLTAFGFSRPVVAQARGSFVKTASEIVYEPNTLYFGSLPVHRLGPLANLVFKRLEGMYEFPADLTTAWAKLVDARLEKRQLVLSNPP
jgi:hypothetical protein